MRSLGTVCLLHSAPSLGVNPMPPYSDLERQNLRERFPQQSRRRPAVKISVCGLRMKVSAGCIELAASSKAPRCYECMPETQDVLCETLEQRDLLCFLNEHSDVAWELPTLSIRISREQSRPGAI